MLKSDLVTLPMPRDDSPYFGARWIGAPLNP